jgi:hypothetical protein
MAEVWIANPELLTLRSILVELQERGHKLRYPENETAPSGKLLVGDRDEAAANTEVVDDTHASSI